ncbi:MAG: TetR/AcrR family transcriptional regulator [Erysipelotrichaceae bacterium]
MGGNIKTTAFLKECIADALIKHLKTKPLEKITVLDIVTTANVGRTTYFRHFSTKNEVLTFKLVKLWQRWAQQHNLAQFNKYSSDNALDFFQFNYSIKDYLILLCDNKLQSVIYDAFFYIMVPQSEENITECYASRFYSLGLFGLLIEWIKRDFNESPQQMAALLKNYPDIF